MRCILQRPHQVVVDAKADVPVVGAKVIANDAGIEPLSVVRVLGGKGITIIPTSWPPLRSPVHSGCCFLVRTAICSPAPVVSEPK